LTVGWYRLQSVTVTERYNQGRAGVIESAGLSIAVDASDRLIGISDYRFLAPEQPAAGATCLGEIKRLCRGILNMVSWPLAVDKNVPASITYGESRLDAIMALANAIDCEAFMDGNGNLVVQPYVRANPAAVWMFSASTDLISIDYDVTRDQIYNAVVARGETTTDHIPVQAVALDQDASSPTKWDGPFGRVPYFMSSPLITTTAEAEAAAKTRLDNLIKNRGRIINIDAVPNPALEIGDQVAVSTPRVTFTGRLTAMTLPLGPQTATLSIRVSETQFAG